MTKLNGKSKDITKDNIKKIKELFPSIDTDGKIDFDKLKFLLEDEIDESPEKYNFTWNGKRQAIRLAQTPSTGTLRPDRETSINFDETENLYIEGDNLEVLKLLQKTYYNKIKMIYIDPPYNTGKDFVYKDNFRDNISNYKEQTNQSSQANPETSGRYHTDWLNMMYPRLMLARNLLTDDGAIFISIDDNEHSNLKKICDEIFGEVNNIGEFSWEKHRAPKNDNKYITQNHEYIIVYAKNKDCFKIKKRERGDDNLKSFKNMDNDPRGSWISGPLLAPTFNKSTVFPIINPHGKKIYPPEGKCWSFNRDGIKKLEMDKRIWYGKDGNNVPRIKRFLNELPSGIGVTSVIGHDEFGGNQMASNQLKKLFDGKKIFDYSKPVNLIKFLIDRIEGDNFIVLDFFSGSSTTAHATIDMNLTDFGNRKFIMVQLPELIDEKSEQYKYGYRNITEIGRDRIIKSGIMLSEGRKDIMNNSLEIREKYYLDIGFKSYKLDSSNIIPWDSSIKYDEKTLFDSVEVFKEERSEEDILYEILLKTGTFDQKIEKTIVNNKLMYSIGNGYSIVCLIDDVTLDDIKEIGKLKPVKVVFKENGFKDDNVKLNSLHTLELLGVKEVISI